MSCLNQWPPDFSQLNYNSTERSRKVKIVGVILYASMIVQHGKKQYICFLAFTFPGFFGHGMTWGAIDRKSVFLKCVGPLNIYLRLSGSISLYLSHRILPSLLLLKKSVEISFYFSWGLTALHTKGCSKQFLSLFFSYLFNSRRHNYTYNGF